jgi:zinc/manganese transport system substrate-binding protein
MVFAGAIASSALLFAGCSGPSTSPGPADGGLSVVASTNVYGSIAEAVGGDRVDVTSLIDSAAQDPHEYEASARDQLRVAKADVVIENGGGFDPFVDGLVQASGTKAAVITAATLSPEYPADGELETHRDDADHAHDHLDGFNEHVFYDPAVMSRLAQAIADELGAIDPEGKDVFAANASAFAAGIDKLETELAAVQTAHEGTGVFVTEPLPLYLTDAAGLDNKTPGEFSEAVEEGQDVPPATLLEALKTISSRRVALVIVNAQAGGPETDRVQQAAQAAGIPTLRFSELLPDGKSYLSWMGDNIRQLADALG